MKSIKMQRKSVRIIAYHVEGKQMMQISYAKGSMSEFLEIEVKLSMAYSKYP